MYIVSYDNFQDSEIWLMCLIKRNPCSYRLIRIRRSNYVRMTYDSQILIDYFKLLWHFFVLRSLTTNNVFPETISSRNQVCGWVVRVSDASPRAKESGRKHVRTLVQVASGGSWDLSFRVYPSFSPAGPLIQIWTSPLV